MYLLPHHCCIQDAATEKLSQASESFEKELHRTQRELAQTKRELAALQDENKKTKKEVHSLQGALDDASSKKVRGKIGIFSGI